MITYKLIVPILFTLFGGGFQADQTDVLESTNRAVEFGHTFVKNEVCDQEIVFTEALPSTDRLEEVKVFDALGNYVMSIPVLGNTCCASSLIDGVYLVKGVDANGNQLFVSRWFLSKGAISL